jgi:pimeloyl-ACP methyl ester carboxylesterase
MRWRLAAIGLMAGVALAAASSSASAEMSLAHPPPGANHFGCQPSRAHPNPVVLVHGLGATMGENWSYLSPILAAQGYCVFALTYGLDPHSPFPLGGVIRVQRSAHELASFVARVRAATGGRKVDLVGHSEGTFMPEYWLEYLGGADDVRRYVAMTPLYRGTELAALPALRDYATALGISGPLLDAIGRLCGSCPQFLAGSAMVRKLDAGGPAVPGVRYTTIPTSHDELVVPYTSGFLHAPNVDNELLQGVCPNDLSEHVAEAFDPVVAQIVLNGLDPAHGTPVSCAGLPPLAPTPTG